ncbi:MAG: Uma2 family endonuclease [Acidobacteria bacterium]|nr:Uma2 family endonuclease [Acidobacteriota bacterium]
MTSTTLDLMEAIDHLPVGGKLQMSDVSWDEYDELLEELEGKRHVRISYDNGRMEIMTLSPEHEAPASLFGHFVQILTEELDLEFISIRSTTLRRKSQLQGKEPDDCFYIGDLNRILGKKRLDIDFDSPPDLAIEVDVTSSTIDKMAIYAGLGVPEVWRYDNYQVEFHRLAEKRYQRVATSKLFSFLPPTVITDHLNIGITQGVNTMRRAFREWVCSHKP